MITPRRLTKVEALRRVAEKLLNGKPLRHGLCWELDMLPSEFHAGYAEKWPHLYEAPTVYLHTSDRAEIQEEMIEHAEAADPGNLFLAPMGTEVEARAMFALLLAEVYADEERREAEDHDEARAA
jgi:hypothetical protein